MNIFDRALGNRVPVLKTKKKFMHSMGPIHLLGSINLTVCFDNHIHYPHLKKKKILEQLSNRDAVEKLQNNKKANI